ncbi:MAG: EAL domain-containing protein [Coriobacteriia bacterium]|nr:EAL domain-containing protein [Coriobacteriia bacterium]
MVLTRSEQEMARVCGEMQRWLEGDFEVNKSYYSVDGLCFCLPDAQRLGDADQLLDYLDFLTIQRTSGTIDQTDLEQDARFREFTLARDYLPKALLNDTLEVFYQPLFDAHTGAFSGFECLSRMSVPGYGYVNPELFISIANDEGLLPTLSDLQISKICDFVSGHRQELERLGVQDFKINISSSEMLQNNLAQRLLNRFDAVGLDPALFTFEITESVAVVYDDVVRALMARLKERGCRFYLDDFGSGYSNLTTVMELPFDGVKMDKSMMALSAADEKSALLYLDVVHMMKRQGLKVVSEGVETASQAKELMEWGVDYLQGYYYSKALPTDEVLSFLTAAR